MEVLSQKNADNIMKELSGESIDNFKLGFHEEKENILTGKDHIWALPPDKRIYYLISLNGNHYLLVGINPTPFGIINLSSFARIVSQPKGEAPNCLRKLIEDKLVPLCRKNGKKFISTRIATDRGEKVFRCLQKEKPTGIREIKINNSACCLILEVF
jgi:hypothetical protein